MFERDVQAIGEEGHEDVRLDAMFDLMVKRTDREIVPGKWVVPRPPEPCAYQNRAKSPVVEDGDG
jgi:hypothetical protein